MTLKELAFAQGRHMYPSNVSTTYISILDPAGKTFGDDGKITEFEPVLLALPSLSPALAVEVNAFASSDYPLVFKLPLLVESITYYKLDILKVLPYGLTFHRIIVQADGRTHDIVIGPEDPTGHVTQKYTNTIIGRYANRIPVGKHSLERNGYKAEFEAMANGGLFLPKTSFVFWFSRNTETHHGALTENPRVSLHGGPQGFNTRTFSLIDISISSSAPPTLFSKAELARLTASSSNAEYPSSFALFRHTSPSGDQGYPGTLLVEALIALIPPAHRPMTYLKPGESVEESKTESALGSIVYVYRAKLLDGEVTAVNLTNHWGFNLDASLNKESTELADVKGHTLLMKADRIVARDADSLNTGNFISTSSAAEHNHNGKKIGEGYPEAGYDDYYVFQPQTVNIPKRVSISSLSSSDFDLVKDLLTPAIPNQAAQGARSPTVVELASTKSGLKLSFDTNQSGAMFYSNGLSNANSGARKKIHGGSGIKDHGDAYTPGTAAFLEFHDILSAFLDPSNKDKEDTLLTRDELYNNYVRCDVVYRAPRA
ncbi:hypothetical protein D9758_011255 [Tetrapyrgos nigripes]|uniref:Uncharacterized protein n=1 Tax=Tetrapyrgos nigripes TaxID=182062 RepID=A0A8H5FRX5_9AGAR|nr:hypothetical protein D9758_011255 [Tetrapyrgos nigripes]